MGREEGGKEVRWTDTFPPSNLAFRVTIKDPSQTITNTPVNIARLCSGGAIIPYHRFPTLQVVTRTDHSQKVAQPKRGKTVSYESAQEEEDVRRRYDER